MGSIFCKCFRSKKCKFCGISEDHFTSNEHRSRPSCRNSPIKPLIHDDIMYISKKNYSYPGLNYNTRKESQNGYHKFV